MSRMRLQQARVNAQADVGAIPGLGQPDWHVTDTDLGRALGLITVTYHGLSTVGQPTVVCVVQNVYSSASTARFSKSRATRRSWSASESSTPVAGRKLV